MRIGFLWLKNRDVTTEYEQMDIDRLARILKRETCANGGTIECVVLNACETEAMGKKLRSVGVFHVVCWRSEVLDTTGKTFAFDFYASLNEQNQGRDYKRAFWQAVDRMNYAGGPVRAPMQHLANGAVDYVCFLSKDGNEFPDTGHIHRGEEGDADFDDERHEEATRMANNPKGQSELRGFKELGFDLKYNGKDILQGIKDYRFDKLDGRGVRSCGLEESALDLWEAKNKIAGKKLLMLHREALQQVFGPFTVKYEDIWMPNGPLDQKARTAEATARRDAVAAFHESLRIRRKQADRRDAPDRAHQRMINMMENCISRIEAMPM